MLLGGRRAWSLIMYLLVTNDVCSLQTTRLQTQLDSAVVDLKVAQNKCQQLEKSVSQVSDIFCVARFTVCTVVQNCCNGRSKKYRKWHFCVFSLSETLQFIDIKFDRDDYVGDES